MPYKARKYTKPKYKKTVKKSKPVSDKRIRAIAKTEISRNIEDKYTNSVTLLGTTVTINGGTNPTLTYYAFNPFTQGMFSITQGTGNSERIGNLVKLKRWIIKGTVYSLGGNPGSAGNPLQCCVIDLYFGRNRDMTVPFDPTLPLFYQDGNTAHSPQGEILERGSTVNKDNYIIYRHKRVKIGPSVSSSPVGATSNNNNNDYKLSYDFGFDVCKLIAKNHKIRFADNNASPNDALLRSLTMWCTVTYANQDLDLTQSSPIEIPVYIAAQSYA